MKVYAPRHDGNWGRDRNLNNRCLETPYRYVYIPKVKIKFRHGEEQGDVATQEK